MVMIHRNPVQLILNAFFTIARTSLPWEWEYLPIYWMHHHSNYLCYEFLNLEMLLHSFKELDAFYYESTLQKLFIKQIWSCGILTRLICEYSNSFYGNHQELLDLAILFGGCNLQYFRNMTY